AKAATSIQRPDATGTSLAGSLPRPVTSNVPRSTPHQGQVTPAPILSGSLDEGSTSSLSMQPTCVAGQGSAAADGASDRAPRAILPRPCASHLCNPQSGLCEAGRMPSTAGG